MADLVVHPKQTVTIHIFADHPQWAFDREITLTYEGLCAFAESGVMIDYDAVEEVRPGKYQRVHQETEASVSSPT